MKTNPEKVIVYDLNRVFSALHGTYRAPGCFEVAVVPGKKEVALVYKSGNCSFHKRRDPLIRSILKCASPHDHVRLSIFMSAMQETMAKYTLQKMKENGVDPEPYL